MPQRHTTPRQGKPRGPPEGGHRARAHSYTPPPRIACAPRAMQQPPLSSRAPRLRGANAHGNRNGDVNPILVGAVVEAEPDLIMPIVDERPVVQGCRGRRQATEKRQPKRINVVQGCRNAASTGRFSSRLFFVLFEGVSLSLFISLVFSLSFAVFLWSSGRPPYLRRCSSAALPLCVQVFAPLALMLEVVDLVLRPLVVANLSHILLTCARFDMCAHRMYRLGRACCMPLAVSRTLLRSVRWGFPVACRLHAPLFVPQRAMHQFSSMACRGAFLESCHLCVFLHIVLF